MKCISLHYFPIRLNFHPFQSSRVSNPRSSVPVNSSFFDLLSVYVIVSTITYTDININNKYYFSNTLARTLPTTDEHATVNMGSCAHIESGWYIPLTSFLRTHTTCSYFCVLVGSRYYVEPVVRTHREHTAHWVDPIHIWC